MEGVMSIAESLLPEFDQEMTSTRRMLERVPGDKAAWKPHPKSFSLGHLAQLVARMPGWQTLTLKQKSLDLSSGPAYSLEKTETLLAEFDRNVRDARAGALEDADEDGSLIFEEKRRERDGEDEAEIFATVAGEHAQSARPGYADGAYVSGLRAAERFLQS